MSRLILGTAEFNPTGYAGESAPSLKEIKAILSLAREGGINMIDTAPSYNCEDLIAMEAKGFCIYTKTRDWRVKLDWGDNELRGILYHYGLGEQIVNMPFIHRWVNIGSSVYCKDQLPLNHKQILQIPFNIIQQQFKGCFNNYRTVFVRSVFARGDALKNHSVKECLDYVKQYRPDGVIIGVQSAKELNQILKAWGA